MKIARNHVVILSSILLLASCSSFQMPLAQLKPLSEGEARLTAIEMPEFVHEGLDYDVILHVDSEATPQISKVCFRWLSEGISSASPSLNCFAANGDYGTGNVCDPRSSVLFPGSDSFCVDASDIRTNVPGQIVVKIRAKGLLPSFNKLQAQAEYMLDGLPRLTNVVKTSITVDSQAAEVE